MTTGRSHRFTHTLLAMLALLAFLASSGRAQADEPKDATAATREANQRLLQVLPFSDRQDFEDAQRGFIAPLPDGGVIRDAQGKTVWDLSRYAFIQPHAAAPATVNPSLWRQMQLVVQGGLYKVVDGLYQVRTADVSNLTIVEGPEGLIVVDPLISVQTARTALELYYRHRPRRPVVAVLYSHSHLDHYGGVRGIVDEKDVRAGRVRIIAPSGFLQAAVEENVLAGYCMTRRATYMYGLLIPAGPRGSVGCGLGVTTSTGDATLIPPTHLVTKTGQKMRIAGLDFEFLMAPGTEAPAEMHWYIEQLKALTAAENCCHTMHNTYTLRGARLRDPQTWSNYLDETIQRWGDRAQVLYGMHQWPVWGNARVNEMLSKGRDAYRFINDQTLRLANRGYSPVEIAEMLELPAGLARHWALRGYYGTLSHNVKATYFLHLGWFDGNPATLHVLPPTESAKKYVAFMGGAGSVLEKARAAFTRGEYRWVAEVVNHVIFADPGNREARQLQADALEQLGYQAESGPWRNFYLTGAKELRDGVQPGNFGTTASPDTLAQMSPSLLLDFLGVLLDGPRAGNERLVVNLEFPDVQEQHVILLRNGALNHRRGFVQGADAKCTLSRKALGDLAMRSLDLRDGIRSGVVRVQGSEQAFERLLGYMQPFSVWFNVVTPRTR